MPVNPFPNRIADFMAIIPFPNAVAGLLIGVVNDLWIARITAPLVWGFTWCVYLWLQSDHSGIRKKKVIIRERWSGDNQAWKHGFRGYLRTHPVLGFYFVEYFTALWTSLVFSVIGGIIRIIAS